MRVCLCQKQLHSRNKSIVRMRRWWTLTIHIHIQKMTKLPNHQITKHRNHQTTKLPKSPNDQITEITKWPNHRNHQITETTKLPNHRDHQMTKLPNQPNHQITEPPKLRNNRNYHITKIQSHRISEFCFLVQITQVDCMRSHSFYYDTFSGTRDYIVLGGDYTGRLLEIT